ncbi:hypothetical protein ACPCG0_11290 [Propionibacteriaceae bacterium Y1923]|uniref:hypothetical protein n=1 Tax=Aestuariimicrobium sp. Y1814 TaxID=3418742 RepID=UPI003C18FD1B
MTPHDNTETVAVQPSLPKPGRPVVLEPLAPGVWTLILGAALAVLAPLFGFLIGTTYGPGDGSRAINPIELGLIAGVIVGGIGVAIALVGAWRLIQRSRAAHGEAARQEAANAE